jgi:TldD protein
LAIDAEVCRKLLAAALGRGGDYADLFFEYRAGGGLAFEEGITKSASRGVTLGLGVPRDLRGHQRRANRPRRAAHAALRRARDRRDNGKREAGSSGGGGRVGLEYFDEESSPE